jgi:hypothetical protein
VRVHACVRAFVIKATSYKRGLAGWARCNRSFTAPQSDHCALWVDQFELLAADAIRVLSAQVSGCAL